MKHLATILILLTCTGFIACGGGGSKSPSTSSQSATVSAVNVVATASSVAAGQTLQLTAIATYNDNTTKDITSVATWKSSDATIATVSSSGLVTAIKAGQFTATATTGTTSGSKTITVTAPSSPAISSILIAPASTTLAIGQTKQLNATGTYTDGTTQDITGTATWSSSNQSVATVNASGMVSAVSVGSASITAVSGSQSATASITVTAPGSPALSSILIAPASTTLAIGQTKQLNATGTYTDGTTQDITGTVTWSSSSQSNATVNASGVVTAESIGQATITATSGSLSATATVSVTGSMLASIAVAPSNASIATGQTQQFSASGIFTDGSAIDMTNSVTWGSDTLGVATLSANIPGLASGVSAGTATISATSGTVVGTAPLVVTAATLTSIDISPDDQSIPIGGQVQYTVTGTYSDFSTQDLTNATFTSSDPTIAVVDPVTGVATGVASSSTPVNITATVGVFTTTTTVTVLTPTLQSLSITPTTASLAVGTTQEFVLTGVFSDGSTEPLSQGVTWTSSASTIATIDLNGVTTGVAAGQSTITATYRGLSSAANVTVVLGPPAAISVTPAVKSMGIGGTQQYTATAVFADGSTQDVTSQAEWISSSASVALVSDTGLANALSMGSAQITAVFQNVSGSATLDVSSAKLVSIAVSPDNPVLPMHAKVQFSATGTFSDGTTNPLSGVNWHVSTTSGSPASKAIINGAGLLRTKKKTAVVTVSATLNGFTGTTTATIVDSSSLKSVAVTPDNSTMAPGTAQQFTLTGVFNNGTTVDLSKSAYWKTSNYQDAIISGSGVVTAIAAAPAITITGTFRTLTGSAQLTVSSASIVSVTVAPAAPLIGLGLSQQFKATGNFSDGSSQDITSVSQWTSSNPAVAVIDTTGLATSAGRGTTNIGATFKTKTGAASLSVN